MELSGNRVLLVEDDALVRRAYERALTPQFDVIAVGSVADGLAALEGRAFGAIVSDIDMPGGSGIELLKTLRASGPQIPVVLVTGCPSVASAQDAVNYGAFRYLTKPVEPATLCDAVARATRLSKLAALHAKSREAIEQGGRAPERVDLEARFERALDGMWMAFQPIVSWRRRAAIGYEALLRTTEPSLARPPYFLAAAEELGRLSELGRRVRAKIAEAIPAAPPRARIFVNLHARDLTDPELLDEAAPLTRHARRVVLEVTERTSLDGVDDVVPRAQALRRAGFSLAIDDLGAGYAGLSSLTQLDPEVVKLDMSLVRGIDAHHAKQQIVRSMVAVCAELGMEVVVEGVETAAEGATLVSLGCDLLQGYHFARPGPGFPEPRFEERS